MNDLLLAGSFLRRKDIQSPSVDLKLPWSYMENFRSKFPDLFATFYHKLSSMVQEQIPQMSSSIHQQREHLLSDVWACWLLDNSRNALQPCLEVTQRWSSIFWLKTEALYSTYVYSLEHKTDEKPTKKSTCWGVMLWTTFFSTHWIMWSCSFWCFRFCMATW